MATGSFTGAHCALLGACDGGCGDGPRAGGSGAPATGKTKAHKTRPNEITHFAHTHKQAYASSCFVFVCASLFCLTHCRTSVTRPALPPRAVKRWKWLLSTLAACLTPQPFTYKSRHTHNVMKACHGCASPPCCRIPGKCTYTCTSRQSSLLYTQRHTHNTECITGSPRSGAASTRSPHWPMTATLQSKRAKSSR